MIDLWISLATGLLLIVISLASIPYGFYYRGFRVPEWGVGILFFIGIALVYLSIRGIKSGRREPKPLSGSDQEVENAKAELEKMYIKEHGKAPVLGGDEEELNKSLTFKKWFACVTRKK